MYVINLLKGEFFPCSWKSQMWFLYINQEMNIFFSNYRPVSVLPVFSKLLENFMYSRLMNFITNNTLLYKYQFGFQKGKSTYMALILLIDEITEAQDKGDCVVGIHLDFSKAFDTVNHNILLQKLSMYGIQDTALEWFRGYLTNRSQYVTYNFKKSTKENIYCGVPQGSVLGPLLFFIYINVLAMVSDVFLSVLFADDTNLFICCCDIEALCNRINEDLEKNSTMVVCQQVIIECDENPLYGIHE